MEDSAAESSASILDAMRRTTDHRQIDMFLAKLDAIQTKWKKIAQEQVAGLAKVEDSYDDLGKKAEKTVKKMKSDVDSWSSSLSSTFTSLAMESELTFRKMGQSLWDLFLSKLYDRTFSSVIDSVIGLALPATSKSGSVSTAGATAASTLAMAGAAAGGMSTGSIIVEQHNNFAEGVSAAARAAIVGAMPQIKTECVNAMKDAQRRSGGRI